MAKMLRLAGQAMTEGFGFHCDELNVCAKVVNRMSIVLGDGRHFDVGLVTLTSELSLELQSGGLGLMKVKFETFAANF